MTVNKEGFRDGCTLHPQFYNPIGDANSPANWQLVTSYIDDYGDEYIIPNTTYCENGILYIGGGDVGFKEGGWVQSKEADWQHPQDKDWYVEVTFRAEVELDEAKNRYVFKGLSYVWGKSWSGEEPYGIWAFNINYFNFMDSYSPRVFFTDENGTLIGEFQGYFGSVNSKQGTGITSTYDEALGVFLSQWITLKLAREGDKICFYRDGVKIPPLVSRYNPWWGPEYGGFDYGREMSWEWYADIRDPEWQQKWIDGTSTESIIEGAFTAFGNWTDDESVNVDWMIGAALEYEGWIVQNSYLQISHWKYFFGTGSLDECNDNPFRDLSVEMYRYLGEETTTTAWCWKLTRQDGVILGFTTHDKDIIYDGVVYEANSGFAPTAVETSGNLSVDNMEMDGYISSDKIKLEDVETGRFDYSDVEVFLLDWETPTNERLLLRKGRIGRVSTGDISLKAEIRGMMQSLQQNFVDVYSKTCRVSLGDSKCGVNIANYTENHTVTAVINNAVFECTATNPAGYYSSGKLTWTSGLNNGLSMEVRSYTVGKIALLLPMPYTISVSDTFRIQAGCNRTAEDCNGRFGNIVNFRGEPQVPGEDFAYAYAIRGTSNVRS